MARHDIREWKAQQTEETLKATCSKGGQATAKKIRKYKHFQEVVQAILNLDVDDPELRRGLEELGLEPTNSNAVALAQIAGAREGGTEQARWVRDTAGDKPTDALKMELENKPVKAMDLSTKSDAELEALADQVDN